MNRPTLLIVGTGPGHPDLITLRGRGAILEADVIFATSNGDPVDPRFFEGTRPGCVVHDSSRLEVEEYYALAVEAVRAGKNVVRLQPGDPSVFGTLAKQIRRFEREGIRVEVVPGVSAGLAAACALGQDLTIPGVSEAIVFTRMEGKTPLLPHQKVRDLAAHRPTFVFYMSATLLPQLVRELETALPRETPIVVGHKVGWPAEKIVRATLADVVDAVRAAGIFTYAVILVGDVLGPVPADLDPEAFW